jgi:DNA-binding LacI/PurR family transcriptional regulator
VAAGIRDHLIDGLIFSPLALTGADLATSPDATTPMVLLGERIDHGPADHVAIDNVAAARDVTAHLVASGRRRIAAIGAQHTAEAATARLRLAGYRLALGEAGIAVDESLIAPAPAWHRAEGAAAMRGLLATGPPPDAVLCFNDTLALGAIRALHDAGLRVPADVAIAGFDDIEDGRYSVPTLTTAAPDKANLARVAVDLLAARLREADHAPPREETVPHRLHVRESTGG